MADYRMPEQLRCPKTGQTWNMRISDEKRLELIQCEGCGEMHTLKELFETGRPKLEIVPTR